VDLLYHLTANNTNMDIREDRIQKIESYFSTIPNKVHWQGLADRSNISRYQSSWFEMKEQLLDKKDDLIQKILTSIILSF
jgi:hypothetical protein